MRAAETLLNFSLKIKTDAAPKKEKKMKKVQYCSLSSWCKSASSLLTRCCAAFLKKCTSIFVQIIVIPHWICHSPILSYFFRFFPVTFLYNWCLVINARKSFKISSELQWPEHFYSSFKFEAQFRFEKQSVSFDCST